MTTLADIEVDDSRGLDDILLWGFGGLKVLIDSLHSKAEDLDDEIMIIAGLLEEQVGVIKSKLQEFDKEYIAPLEEKVGKE